MTRKEAVKAAIKMTGQLGLEFLKRQGLIIAASGVVLVGIALVKPNFYKDIDQK